jgi:multiple sugar transport system permease protein
MGSGSLAVVLAGVIISLIIPILIFVIAQRYIIEGMRIGGLKG